VIPGAFRTIAYVNGLFCLYVALAMVAPMTVDYLDGNEDWYGFLASGFVIGTLSAATVLATRGNLAPFNLRIGFLLVVSLWLSTSLVATLPLMLGSRAVTFTDALFETVSGLTTTGSTVLTGLDDMPRGLLLWRSTIQWLGGIGIVAMSLLILPFLRIGGMQFFRLESSERSEKPVARIQTFAIWLVSVYGALTLACMILYRVGGMTWFDAMNHAMTTLPTAGYGTHDSSFAQYSNWVLITAIAFMLIGAVPFATIAIALFTGSLRRSLDAQVPIFIAVTAALCAIAFAAALESEQFGPTDALIHATFNLVSNLTTTGYASADYTQWGPVANGAFLVAMLVGGCAGSTAGGLKIYRVAILYQSLRVSMRELVYPSGVFPIHFSGKRVSPEALRSVANFLFAYVAILFVSTLLFTGMGLDLVTAISGALTAMSNVGPGLGPIIGPAGNFASLPDEAKWLLTLLMLLGRLEIMTVLVILSPLFWRGT
jgi:trk system potassium uptake protein TrkH